MRAASLIAAMLTLSMTSPALAYIGPGAGAGTIAVVLGILASIAMAFVALLWYPVKRLIRSRKPARAPAHADTAATGPEGETGRS